MEHRRFLSDPAVHHAFRGGDLLARVGGEAAVETLVEGLYARIEADAALRPLFGRDLASERAAQKRFFAEWLGDGTRYSDGAQLPLKHRHDLLPITRQLAERWVAHFADALAAAVPDVAGRRTIEEKVSALAMALINERGAGSQLRAHPHGTCLRYPPAIETLTEARRGDAAALRRLIRGAPDMLGSAPHAAHLMHLAVRGGHEASVAVLLDAGVDANKPHPIAPLIFVTPLCVARMRRRQAIDAMLRARGAEEDIFTHALLGDLDRLEEQIGAAQAIDPAVDALQVTPVHHAVAGGKVEALRLLLGRIAGSNAPLIGSARALRDAVRRENVAMVAMLLAQSADAGLIGAGRWVLHSELAPMLARAGARIDRSGAWIGLACTGNQGRKDDPDFVTALLRHGARVDDRRLAGQGSDGGRATALHYAARAGFVKTTALLLDCGADPTLRDDNGLTPLDWLARAAPSVDRAAIRRLLQRRH